MLFLILTSTFLVVCPLSGKCSDSVAGDSLESDSVIMLQTSGSESSKTLSLEDGDPEAHALRMLQTSMDLRANAGADDVYSYVEELVADRVAQEEARASSVNLEQGDVEIIQDLPPERIKNQSTNQSTANSSKTPGPKSQAAKQAGVSANAAGDLKMLLSSMSTNGAIIGGCFLFFGILRWYMPLIYSYRADEREKRSINWVYYSLRLSVDEITERAGLDHGMLIEFTQLAMKTLLAIGVPALAVLSTLDYFLGGNAAGDDQLSRIGMNNVKEGSEVCWAHAVFVWYVVVVVQTFVFQSQSQFLPRRFKWLKEMPKLRATTVLVQSIPEDKRSDTELRKYFDVFVFGHRVVKDLYFVKDTSQLTPLVKTKQKLEAALHRSHIGRKHAGMLFTQKSDLERQISKIAKQVDDSDEYNSDSAFVTFFHRREATIAIKLLSPDDEEMMEVIEAPDPSDVIWTDLLQNQNVAMCKEILGYLLIAGIFFAFLPVVAAISAFTSIEGLKASVPKVAEFLAQYPDLATTWNGFMSSVALSLVMSFIPTFLVIIFKNCFILKAEAYMQHRIQQWYFYFLLVFVLLVTAVGTSLIRTTEEVIRAPMSVFSLLAQSMPSSTHFYMNYFTVQWATHAMNATRYINLVKFIFLTCIYGAVQAREFSEPEDQDYYGMGSRSARFTLLFVIALVFCTIAPIMTVFGFINFALCRLVYGYLFTFAESKKPDLGGMFWYTQLRHVQQSLFVYIALMTGVLMQKGSTVYPGCIAASSYAFLFYTYQRFKLFRWENLEFEDVKEYDSHARDLRKPTLNSYKQPDLPAAWADAAAAAPQAIRQAMGELQARLGLQV